MPRELSEGEFTAIKSALLSQAPDGLNEQEFDRWFTPRFDGAIAQAEHSNAPVSGGALRRFLSNAGSMLNPIPIAQAGLGAVSDLVTGNFDGQLVQAQVDQWNKAKNAPSVTESLGHGLAAVTPLVGPVAARAGEQIASGDVAGGLGATAGLVAPFAASAALRGRVAQRAQRGDPAKLEREAARQVADRVLAPGAAKFKGKAETIAPEILKRGLTGGRDDLIQAADEGMSVAAQRIDDAITAGGGPGSGVMIDPIVRQLRQRLEGLLINGEPIKGAEGRVAGLRERIAQLERTAKTPPQRPGLIPTGTGRAKPLRALSFDDLKRFRDEQYRIANDAKAYQRMGNPSLSDEGFAAAEAGSAVRQEFARLSPELAAANADYSFFKTLGDVLDPAQGRPKVTAPSSGITGGAATSGAVAGSLISPKAAFVLSVVRPWIQNVRSTPAWQMADAQSKMRLAQAIRNGEVPLAQRLMAQISEGAVLASQARTGTERPSGESAR